MQSTTPVKSSWIVPVAPLGPLAPQMSTLFVQHSASVHGSAAQLMPAGLASSSFACEEQSCASSAVPSPLLSAQVRVQTPGPGTCGLQLRQVQLLVEV